MLCFTESQALFTLSLTLLPPASPPSKEARAAGELFAPVLAKGTSYFIQEPLPLGPGKTKGLARVT